MNRERRVSRLVERGEREIGGIIGKLAVLFLVTLGLGIVGWRLWARLGVIRNPPPAENLVAVLDNSVSQNGSANCEALAAMVKAETAKMHLGAKSRFSLLTLGDAHDSFEPVRQLDRKISAGMFGQSQLVSDIKKACAGFTQVPASSIFRAVQVSLNYLHGLGVSPDSRSRLILESDLEENIERRFFGKGAMKTVIPVLDNTNIDVIACGYAVTESGGPRGPHTDALLARWRTLFKDQSRLTFLPYCEGSGMHPHSVTSISADAAGQTTPHQGVPAAATRAGSFKDYVDRNAKGSLSADVCLAWRQRCRK
jgi:hypothetical protein